MPDIEMGEWASLSHVVGNLSPETDFDFLDRGKQQTSQLVIEIVEGDRVGEARPRAEAVLPTRPACVCVRLRGNLAHGVRVGGEPVIPDSLQLSDRIVTVFYGEAPVREQADLLFIVQVLLRVLHRAPA
ncbi:hypothetical protein HMPREF3121_02980 [Corynebacterium sp. HMSC11E11]|nr:hypothetical protein HMPREF3121_02980 [Corynebacterium sp. HMSC11E11]